MESWSLDLHIQVQWGNNHSRKTILAIDITRLFWKVMDIYNNVLAATNKIIFNKLPDKSKMIGVVVSVAKQSMYIFKV